MAQPADANIDCSPELPTELKFDILDLTARMYPQHATKLALISKHVQTLVEAIVYKTVFLDSPLSTILFLRTVNSRSPEFFAKNVKSLHLTGLVTYFQAERILPVCAGITSLTCWVDVPYESESLLPLIHTPLLHTKNLTKLSVRDEFWREPPLNSTSFHEFFPNLSHLYIVDICIPSRVDWSWIYNLPSLTHLSFRVIFATDLSISEFLRRLLRNCEFLQKLTVVANLPSFFVPELQDIDLRDPRLVFFPDFRHPKTMSACWEETRRGELGFWIGTVGRPSGS